MLKRPGHGLAHGVCPGVLRHRSFDVLRLSALPVRCDDEMARHRVGGIGSQARAHQVEARVEPGGRSGGGQDVAVVDVQH